MGEPFKNLVNAEVVRSIGMHLHRADRKFARRDFEARACAGLEALELKARVLHVADALVAALPADVDRACGLLEASPGEHAAELRINCQVVGSGTFQLRA